MPKIPVRSSAAKPSPPPSRRRERLAINIFDLTSKVPAEVRGMLFDGKVDTSGHVRVDPERGDEAAVIFCCDLLTAACICDTVRDCDRAAGEFPTRVYVCRERAWTKLPADAVLTVKVVGNMHLNPRIFPPEQSLVPLQPKAARRMTFEKGGGG